MTFVARHMGIGVVRHGSKEGTNISHLVIHRELRGNLLIFLLLLKVFCFCEVCVYVSVGVTSFDMNCPAADIDQERTVRIKKIC
jgi:hypothetical protein